MAFPYQDKRQSKLLEIKDFLGKEFDTYKVATVRNSCSTMHKLADKPITRDCFSWDGYSDLRLIDPTGSPDSFIDETISNCEQLRQLYLNTGDIACKHQLKRPS